jgi:anaerobic magnesium-protoporphyrin IX monomethyl ester cyclase
MKIVIANSVGIDSNGYHMVHVPSRWSLGVKNFTNCGYYPWELAYTSSLLKRDTNHDIKFLDGVLNAWDFDQYFEHLQKEKPDWLVMESSTRTISEDLRLAKAAKNEFNTKIIMTGQHPMAEPEEVLRVADFVCVGEYEFAVLDLVLGKNPKNIPGVYPNPKGELPDINLLPFPEDDDIRRIDYHEPNCRFKQIQMYGSRGCPRRCNFCAAATLYYDQLNWRPRNISSIIEEIKVLKEKYPEMEGVFFDEETHNIHKNFNIELAQEIQKNGLGNLKYEAMCEYFSLDEEALVAMKSAGYYKIRFGIETGSDHVAKQMTLGKKHDLKKLRSILNFGKDIEMQFYATISVGGLGSSLEEDQKTVNLIYELASNGLIHEIQVSINTPQPGTDFYNSCIEKGLLKNQLTNEGFDGNGHVVVEYPNYRSEQIQEKQREALAAFDLGKAKANASSFMKTANKSLKSIPKNSNILILRCARLWLIQNIIEAMNQFRKTRVDLLGQNTIAEELKSNSGIKNIYNYGDGFFSLETIEAHLIKQLKNKEYDYVFIPVANNHLEGYRNVLDVARLIEAKVILGVYPEGNVFVIEEKKEAAIAFG